MCIRSVLCKNDIWFKKLGYFLNGSPINVEKRFIFCKSIDWEIKGSTIACTISTFSNISCPGKRYRPVSWIESVQTDGSS